MRTHISWDKQYWRYWALPRIQKETGAVLVDPGSITHCVPSKVEGELVNWFLITPARTPLAESKPGFQELLKMTLSGQPGAPCTGARSLPAERTCSLPGAEVGFDPQVCTIWIVPPSSALRIAPLCRLHPFSTQHPNVPQASTNLRTGCVQHCVTSSTRRPFVQNLSYIFRYFRHTKKVSSIIINGQGLLLMF